MEHANHFAYKEENPKNKHMGRIAGSTWGVAKAHLRPGLPEALLYLAKRDLQVLGRL